MDIRVYVRYMNIAKHLGFSLSLSRVLDLSLSLSLCIYIPRYVYI